MMINTEQFIFSVGDCVDVIDLRCGFKVASAVRIAGFSDGGKTVRLDCGYAVPIRCIRKVLH